MNLIKTLAFAFLSAALSAQTSEKKIDTPRAPDKIRVAPSKPTVTATSSTPVGIPHKITVVAVEDEKLQLCYGFDWNNDGVIDEYTSYVDSGKSITITHTWTTKGTYAIKVYAKSPFGQVSQPVIHTLRVE